MNGISLQNDTLTLGDGLCVSFLRTLRIPDDGKTYPLPPGLGRFPVRRIDDYADKVPLEWRERGGVFLPMYQREAMWISFSGQYWKPRAVKVAIGKVCAITGERWRESLSSDPQSYVVTPPQPWLDGIAIKRGVIRQFVAMPLGLGYTVEGEVTGEESVGGLQLKVFEPKPGRFPDEPPPSPYRTGAFAFSGMPPAPACGAVMRSRGGAMGLAAGGRMKQSIYPDPHGIDTWDATRTSRVFVHIVNSAMWREITGEEAPPSPITARDYAAHRLPWFELYDEQLGALSGTGTLAGVRSVKEMDGAKSTLPLQDDDPVGVGPVRKLWTAAARALAVRGVRGVRDGKW
jgi:hypothetical protein